MKGLVVLLDTEKFPLPQQNNLILEVFLSIKKEIIKTLRPLEEKTMGTGCVIIITLRPDKITWGTIINDDNLKQEITYLLGKNLDISKIAGDILTRDMN